MSNINESKKINKKKKKKRNEISLEEYAKENNLSINIGLKDEEDDDDEDINEKNPKKSNYLVYHSNIINDKKNETPKKKNNFKNNNNLNWKKTEIENYKYKSYTNLNVPFQKQSSESTNNSSLEEDNKMYNNDNNITKIIKNAINENKDYKISNAIKNTKILDSFKKNSYYSYNPYNININFNNKINLNSIYYINNNLNNIDLFKACKYTLTYNYYLYSDKLKNIQKDLNEVEKEIQKLNSKTPYEFFLMKQKDELINYIYIKNPNLINDNNNNKIIDTNIKETPEHQFFYSNHEEEIQINNVLYLIEGLFNENNLKKDFNLLNMLDRDGFASLSQLEKHPQIMLCGISKIHLNTVFSEHRENEITETVETFDDILIRNKNWRKIKKKISNIDEIKKNEINKKEIEMKTIREKKQNLLNMKGKILYKYQINNMNVQQKMNEIQFNNYNIYNNNFNMFNNIYNNNVYNNTIYKDSIYNHFYTSKGH